MSNFKVGDRVRRIEESYSGMKKGDVDIVVRVSTGGLELRNYGCGCHDESNFELVTPEFTRGERVLVSNVEGFTNESATYERIFLTTIKGASLPNVIVRKDYEYEFNKSKKFQTTAYRYIKKLPPKETITLSPEQAIAKLKETMGNVEILIK